MNYEFPNTKTLLIHGQRIKIMDIFMQLIK